MTLKSLTAAVCVAAMAATSMPAYAAPLGGQLTRIDTKNAQLMPVDHRRRRYTRRHYRRHHHNDGAFLALGLFGLGLAIASQDRRYDRPSSCRPWSRAWYDYCEWRYQTFNPRTGYYYYRPGRQRFCSC